MAESTATLLLSDGETKSRTEIHTAGRRAREASEPQTHNSGFFGAANKNVYLLGVAVGILLVSALIGLATLSVGKGDLGQSGYSLLYNGASVDSADPRDLGNMEVAVPPIAAPQIGVPVLTAHQFERQLARKDRKFSAVQAPGPYSGPCSSQHCRNQADYLKRTLNFTQDPCHNLYDFVCGNFWVHKDGPYAQAEEAIRNATISALSEEALPSGHNQNAFQKASALFQACSAFTNSYRNELDDLKSLMIWLNLDLLNLHVSEAVDPVDMVARLSFDVGIPTLFEFKLFDDDFIQGKRAMQFKISDSQEAWQRKRISLVKVSPTKVLEYFSNQFLYYPGYDPQKRSHKELVQAIQGYDQAFFSAVNINDKGNAPFIIRAVQDMGLHTAPQITAGQWSDVVKQYTKSTYLSGDLIQFQKEVLGALAGLIKAANWGPDGFRAKLAWGIFDALVDYALPQKLVGGKDKQVACYHHVLDVMELAATSRYLRCAVSSSALRQAADMFFAVRDAFASLLLDSKWLVDTGRKFVMRTVHKMKALVGSPGERLDEDFINMHFAGFPVMAPNGRFLDAWFKALSARAHLKWTDQTHVLFNISRASPFYLESNNSVVIPAGALLPAFFYDDGNPALNLGTLGSALAHQVMNAFDVCGAFNYCYSGETQKSFASGLQCLRESNAKEGQPRSTDTENIADLMGVVVGYDVFRALPPTQRSWTLPDVNLTSEQLFFVGRCTTLCKFDNTTPTRRLAGTSRTRCNVPAMNVRHFSAAFDCGSGARMNPEQRCSFWN